MEEGVPRALYFAVTFLSLSIRIGVVILKEERITTPILIDSDRKVTAKYKALGTPSSMHDDRAGHTYIHINTEGKIHSSADFPNMNVPVNDLIQHIQQIQT